MSERINTTVGKNNDRQEGSKQPEYKGKVDKCPYCNEGPIYTSYWVRTNGQTGERFFSGEAQKPREKQGATKPVAS
jgi:hypothetical protein